MTPGDVFGEARDKALADFRDGYKYGSASVFEAGWDACWKYLATNGFPEIEDSEVDEVQQGE
ncbi:hypothetical protein CMI37_14990 [Candidatus Pacearchaeota archaeon]|nr:hypothetical protein [Candidatus Pacearchaeota archaeon]|tara:strand:+ start:148 stop:333 length:186 start_codon:yes stop_codon:yes gene_type:complete